MPRWDQGGGLGQAQKARRDEALLRLAGHGMALACNTYNITNK